MASAGLQQTVVGDHNIVTGTGDIRINYNLPPAESEQRRLLLQLTESVRRFWIAGVLEHSVHEANMVALRKESRPQAVEHPWARVLELPNQAAQSLGAERKIGEVFAGTGRTLLILGEPGAGKTVTLLELARDLIERFEKDPTQAAPVVLNLSTWERGDLAAWIEMELKNKYFIPPRRTRDWLGESRLILLLDGLDELPADRGAACIDAINRYLKTSGAPGISVCCRLAEYQAFPERLHFSSAVCLQPLDQLQIDEYLARGGTQLVALREVIGADPLLQEMSRSPLMLNIICLAYSDLPREVIAQQSGDTAEKRRGHLFERYIERMFQRVPRAAGAFSESQTKAWLSWLASRMHEHSLTIFLIESLQPSWLPTARMRTIYALLSRTLTATVWIFVGWLLLLAVVPGAQKFLLEGTVMTLFLGFLAGGIAGVLADWRMRAPPVGVSGERRRVLCEVLFHPFIFILVTALVAGPFFVEMWRFFTGNDFGMQALGDRSLGGLIGLRYGIAFGLIFGLKSIGRSANDDIRLSGALRLSAAKARAGAKWVGLGGSCFFGIFLALALYANWEIIRGELKAPSTPFITCIAVVIAWLILTLICGLFFAALGALFGMLAPTDRPPTGRPGYGLWLASSNAILASLTITAISGAVAMLLNFLTGSPQVWRSLVVNCSGFGLAAGIWYGGQDVLQHITLRLLSRRKGSIPRKFTQFLDHSARLIFLQKVGSGYIFIHRQLLEHFAGMEARSSSEKMRS